MIGGAVSALVLGALSVGMASPATAAGPLPVLAGACGNSQSSVTACPANVLMLQEAGILAMPGATGGTVGVVAQTNTAGAAIGGGLGLLSGLAATWGLSQLFNAGGTTVQSAPNLRTDGLHDLTITPNGDVPGQIASKNYTGNDGKVSGSARIYAVVPYPFTDTPPHSLYCVSSTASLAGSSGVAKYAGGYSANVNWSASTGQPVSWCPAMPAGAVTGGYMSAEWGEYHVYDHAMVTWSPTANGPQVGVDPPAVSVAATRGTFKIHTWCADPVNPGGPLVDYMTAQIATIKTGQSVNLADQKCPSGNAAADASIDWTPDAGGGTTQILPPRGDAAVRADPAVAANIARPECATGSCLLVLTHTNGEPCGAVGELCPDWAKDPNYTSNYKCTFGGTAVGLDSCSVYRSPKDGIQPNTKIDGTPYSPTDPAVKPGGQTVGDPSQPKNPDGSLKTPPVVTDVVTGQDPNGCRMMSWIENLNPFNMFQTIGCAMQTAFVPDAAKVQTAVTQVQNSWANTPPVKVSVMVNEITASLPAGSGCSGITFTFPGVLGVAAQNFTVLNACAEPVAGVALIVRIVGAIGMIIFGILALTKMAGGVIALPGLGKTGGDS
jgi:hypothetical protein